MKQKLLNYNATIHFKKSMSRTEQGPKIRHFLIARKWVNLTLQFDNNVFHLLILKPMRPKAVESE